MLAISRGMRVSKSEVVKVTSKIEGHILLLLKKINWIGGGGMSNKIWLCGSSSCDHQIVWLLLLMAQYSIMAFLFLYAWLKLFCWLRNVCQEYFLTKKFQSNNIENLLIHYFRKFSGSKKSNSNTNSSTNSEPLNSKVWRKLF